MTKNRHLKKKTGICLTTLVRQMTVQWRLRMSAFRWLFAPPELLSFTDYIAAKMTFKYPHWTTSDVTGWTNCKKKTKQKKKIRTHCPERGGNFQHPVVLPRTEQVKYLACWMMSRSIKYFTSDIPIDQPKPVIQLSCLNVITQRGITDCVHPAGC